MPEMLASHLNLNIRNSKKSTDQTFFIRDSDCKICKVSWVMRTYTELRWWQFFQVSACLDSSKCCTLYISGAPNFPCIAWWWACQEHVSLFDWWGVSLSSSPSSPHRVFMHTYVAKVNCLFLWGYGCQILCQMCFLNFKLLFEAKNEWVFILV